MINLAIHRVMVDDNMATFDRVEVVEALKRLEAEGADVVGLNCALGPDTMMPLMERAKTALKVKELFITSSLTKPSFIHLHNYVKSRSVQNLMDIYKK